MKIANILVVGLILSAVSACVSTPQKIVLPNGEQVLTINCTGIGMNGCFALAGDTCPKGYKIYERTKDEFTESKIPTSELKAGDLDLSVKQVQPTLKDQYMIISCAA